MPADGAPGPARAAPPKLVQLSYQEVDDGTAPRFRLMAFARRTESLTFRARYRGRVARAGSRYNPGITDTDLRGRASHPFVIRPQSGARHVLKLLRRALKRKGVAKVWVRMRGEGGVRSARVRVVLADCAQEPPFYPVDCEVAP